MNIIAWLSIGFLLGLIFVNIAGRQAQNERFLLGMGIVVGAWIYVPLALVSKSDIRWLATEIMGAAIFTAVAWAGLRYSIWWLVVGWATHIAWDAGLHLIGKGNEFTASWYPLLCIAFDLVVAIYILLFARQENRAIDAHISH